MNVRPRLRQPRAVAATVRGARGVALILVLWVVVLLTVIAGSFVYAARSSALVAGNVVAVARARALADAGVFRGLYEIARAGNEADAWKADGRVHVFTLDGGEVRVVVRDESAKIDLNTASDALLEGLLRAAGLDADHAAQLRDAILDWRDADDLARPQGAERDRYEALGLPYIPANAPFQSVDELLKVVGMTPDLYRRLAGALTVHSHQPGITSTLASRQVLLAIPGAQPEDVDAYLAEREQALAAGQTPAPFLLAKGFEVGAGTQVYNVQSFATAADGTRYAREASARLTADPRQPFQFLQWQEGSSP